MERIAEFLGVEYQDRMLEGPVYNPWYPQSGRNQETVNRSQKENIDFKLDENFSIYPGAISRLAGTLSNDRPYDVRANAKWLMARRCR